MNRIYLFITKYSSEELLEILKESYDKYPVETYDNMMKVKKYESFEMYIGGKWGLVVKIPNENFEEIKTYLDFIKVSFDYEDITTEVLHNIIDFESWLENFPSLLEMINKYRDENITMDIILDKVVNYGESSLSDFDKKKLEEFAK